MYLYVHMCVCVCVCVLTIKSGDGHLRRFQLYNVTQSYFICERLIPERTTY